MPTSPTLTDAEIDHQIDLIKYGNGRAKTLLPFMLEIVEYLEVRLAKEGESIASKKRLDALIKDAKEKLDVIYSDWENSEFESIIPDVAEQEILFQASAVESVVVGYESVIPAVSQVESAAFKNPLVIGSKGGAFDFGKYTTGWKKEEINRVVGAINGGFYSGQTVTQITRNIVGLKSQKYADGILNISRANIQGMVKNTISHMSVEAKETFNKQNSDLIIGYKIVATLDSKTSDKCKDEDGNEYYYVDGYNQPKPPFHHGGCRTTTSPILSPEYQFTMKAATRPSVTEVDGKATAEEVSSKTTYYEWLKTQPKSVIDKALGKEKGRIFRNAGLSASEFKKAATNSLGQSLTLDEIKANNKKIAEYLNK